MIDFLSDPTWIFNHLIFLIGGFSVGFVFKNFGKSILWIIIILAVGLTVLNYFGLVTVKHAYISQFFGVSFDSPVSELFNQIFSWLQKNITETIASVLGFYLSLELT